MKVLIEMLPWPILVNNRVQKSEFNYFYRIHITLPQHLSILFKMLSYFTEFDIYSFLQRWGLESRDSDSSPDYSCLGLSKACRARTNARTALLAAEAVLVSVHFTPGHVDVDTPGQHCSTCWLLL